MSALGILGGTFDPPHRAHTAMAAAAREKLGLDRVLLMPARVPPHKPGDGPADFDTRVEMARIAAEALDGVEVSRFEGEREGPSYTVELLRALRAGHPDDIYFLMGADSLHDLGSWREPAAVMALCTLVVFPRPGVDIIPPPGPASVIVFESPLIDASSTDVRNRLSRGESVGDLVAPGVESFIRERGLYV